MKKYNYEIFAYICEKTGTSTNKVAKETGINGATFSSWKNGVYEPKEDKIEKIADFFKILPYFFKQKNLDDVKEKLDEALEIYLGADQIAKIHDPNNTSDFIESEPSLRAFSKSNSEVAKTALLISLMNHYHITPEEIDLIIKFRDADDYDKISISRTLNYNPDQQKRMLAYYNAIKKDNKE